MRPPLYKGQNVIPKMVAFIERFHCNSLCMELIRPAQITAATSFQPSCIHGAGMFHCCKHVNLRQISNPLQITSLLASHAHLCYYRDHSVQRSRVCVCRVIFSHTELTVGKYCFCPTMHALNCPQQIKNQVAIPDSDIGTEAARATLASPLFGARPGKGHHYFAHSLQLELILDAWSEC